MSELSPNPEQQLSPADMGVPTRSPSEQMVGRNGETHEQINPEDALQFTGTIALLGVNGGEQSEVRSPREIKKRQRAERAAQKVRIKEIEAERVDKIYGESHAAHTSLTMKIDRSQARRQLKKEDIPWAERRSRQADIATNRDPSIRKTMNTAQRRAARATKRAQRRANKLRDNL